MEFVSAGRRTYTGHTDTLVRLETSIDTSDSDMVRQFVVGDEWHEAAVLPQNKPSRLQ